MEDCLLQSAVVGVRRALPDRPRFTQIATSAATRAGQKLLRKWLTFFDTYAVLVMPVSAELPFEKHRDMQGDDAFARVWQAQMPQLGLPYLGLPALTKWFGPPSN